MWAVISRSEGRWAQGGTIAGAGTPNSNYSVAWIIKPGSSGFSWASVTGISPMGGDPYVSGTTLASVIHGGVLAVGHLARMYPNGSFQWVATPTASGYLTTSLVNGIVAAPSGVYIAGTTDGTFSGQTSFGYDDAYIQKYDLSGNLVWTNQFGTGGDDEGNGIAMDATGLYVVGSTNGVFSGQKGLGGEDAFLAKFDFAGSLQWVRQFGTFDTDQGLALATDASGVYAAGSVRAALPTQLWAGGSDAFLVKFDPGGTWQWAREVGSNLDDTATGVASSASGVYLAGATQGTLPGQTSLGGQDGFLRKYTANGTTVWGRDVGTASSDRLRAVAADDAGAVVVGDTFGVLSGGVSAGYLDGLAARVDPNGDSVWSSEVGTWTNDSLSSVALDSQTVFAGGITTGAFPCTPPFRPPYAPFGAGSLELADGIFMKFLPATGSTTPSVGTAPSIAPVVMSPAAAIPGQGVTFASAVTDADNDSVSVQWGFCDQTLPGPSTPPGGGPVSITDAFTGSGSGTYPIAVMADDGHGGTTVFRTSVILSEPALLRVFTNPPVSAKISMDGVPMDEWGLNWVNIPPGNHVVSFGDAYGYTTPSPVAVNSFSAQTTTVRGDYAAHGFLRIVTNPPVPSTISVNGVPRDDWGMWQSVPPGTYTVSFGAVAGYQAPASQTVTVYAGETTLATGTFLADPHANGPTGKFGLLRVTTEPAVPAKILVDGVPRDEWGLNWLKLSPGSHLLSFTGVYGTTAPPPATIQITDGATTTYVGRFLIHGSLRVVTDPAVPATIFVNGLPRDQFGMWQSMPPGTYKVSFGFLPGYVTPAPQTISVTAGNVTTVTGTYTAPVLAAGIVASPAIGHRDLGAFGTATWSDTDCVPRSAILRRGD